MLQNELVQVQKWDIFTTSDLIAKKLEVKHIDILKTIEKLLLKIDGEKSPLNINLDSRSRTPKFEEKFIKTEFEHWKTKIKYDWYLINESAFTILIMQLWNYKKALQIQRVFVKQFFQMKEVLQNKSNNSWIEARDNWKQLRKEETDIIKELTEYAERETWKPLSYPLYSTYTQMTNKYLQFIVDVKEWQPIRNLSWIRDLWFIWIVDDRCKNAIIDWMNRNLPYKEIYYYAKEEIIKIVNALDFKPKNKELS